jgi:hypothetical protein
MCQDVYNHAATIGPYAITIYVILRCHADGKTSEPVWPGLTRLQKLSGFSRSIVVKALRALLKVGLIEVTLRGAQQHQYRFPKLVHAVNQSTVRTGSPDEPNRFTARTSTGSRDEPELVHAVNPNKTQLPRLNEQDSITKTKERASRRKKSRTLESPEFARFYAAYPRKVGRKKAGFAYYKATMNSKSVSHDALLAAVEAQKAAGILKPNDQYTPYPATWLNGRRWEDELLPTNGAHHNGFKPRPGTNYDPSVHG